MDAIRLVEADADGFLYPCIDEEKCINCNRCHNLCPEENINYLREEYHVRAYAGYAQDSKIRNRSSSGGIFYPLAIQILRRGGVVSGAVYDERLYVKHCLISDIKDIWPLLISKYMQSDMRNIYREIASALSEEKEVLFCGTPCQVSALRQYVNYLHLEKNLFLVDLLCRGVPSSKAAHVFMKELESKHGKQITFVTLKDKTFGWHKQKSRYFFDDGTSVILEDDTEDFFARSFILDDFCVRQSCFRCRYKSRERCSDITIGDFWGIDDNEMDNDKGTSAIFVNTSKGMALFAELMGTDVVCKECAAEDIMKGNMFAFAPLKNNIGKREYFWKLLETEDYKTAVLEAERLQ